MHILHTEASLGWGGQEIRILTEIQGTMARGHRVTLIAAPDSNIAREAVKRGIETVVLPVGRKKLAGLMALRRWLKAQRVDVINTHSSTDTWLSALACMTLRAAPPLVRTRHISAPIPNNFSSRWLYQRATAFVATTGEKVREQVIRETGIAASRVRSVPTGIDLKRYAPDQATNQATSRAQLGLDGVAFIIGIVATLRSWKGHRYLIEALAALPESTQLVIVGDGPQREALAQQVAAAGLQARVTFTGNREDVEQWMRVFDLFVLPSYANEGVPQALMQAMACGLPVISTPVGSIAEIVSDGQTGLLIPPQDSAAIEKAVGRLMNDSALRQQLGETARARALARFGDTLMVDRMLDIFEQVQKHAAPTPR